MSEELNNEEVKEPINEQGGDTPAEETAADEASEQKSDENFDDQGIKGETATGVVYTLESPEVIKFKELFPEVSDDAAIGSVVGMHQAITEGSEIANAEEVAEIIEMIKAKIAQPAE